MLSPRERQLRARLAAYHQHALHDPRETTAAARDAFHASFLDQVDPTLPPAERERRAESLRRAHYTRMAFESAKARRLQRDAAPSGGAQ